MKQVLLEISQNSQENTCVKVSILIKLQVSGNFIKIDSSTGAFLWILRNVQEHLFLQNTCGGYFCIKSFVLGLGIDWNIPQIIFNNVAGVQVCNFI